MRLLLETAIVLVDRFILIFLSVNLLAFAIFIITYSQYFVNNILQHCHSYNETPNFFAKFRRCGMLFLRAYWSEVRQFFQSNQKSHKCSEKILQFQCGTGIIFLANIFSRIRRDGAYDEGYQGVD